MGGRSIGGFLKEAPKPPRTFHEFVFDRTNALRQSHAESLFQRQFNAARVQPPDTCMTGSTDNAGGQAPAGCGRRPIPAPPGFSRRNTCLAESINAAPRQVPGMQGAKPLA